jgi:DNA-binding winged helix-turn-helix (wHTH) protein/Flp pilus assembly protein TadD
MQPTGGFAYGAFRLDPLAKRVFRDGSPVPLKRLQFALLEHFLNRPGELVTKDDLMQACWGRIVSEDCIVQAVSRLRRVPGVQELGAAIETVARQGYRFEPGTISTSPARASERLGIGLPHRLFMNGRAALLSLTTRAVEEAEGVFERLVDQYPYKANYFIGYANALALLHEARRTRLNRDHTLLPRAREAALRARELDPDSAEARATLGFILDRLRDTEGAIESLLEATERQRDNWRHWLRLVYASWGQIRLDAVLEVLKQVPGCPMAHCFAAMVWIARNALDRAGRELDLALAALANDPGLLGRSPLVGLYWMKGLLCLARGNVDQALEFFRRELALEVRGHIYAQECCANTWYAIGVCLMYRGDHDGAREAFRQAEQRVPGHPMAMLGLEILDGVPWDPASVASFDPELPMPGERLLVLVVRMSRAGDRAGAASLLAMAMSMPTHASTGWMIPIEPLLGVQQSPDLYAGVLRQLSDRAL